MRTKSQEWVDGSCHRALLNNRFALCEAKKISDYLLKQHNVAHAD